MEGANKLFGEYDDSYNITKAGGNDIAVLRLISSTASMYSNILLVRNKFYIFFIHITLRLFRYLYIGDF